MRITLSDLLVVSETASITLRRARATGLRQLLFAAACAACAPNASGQDARMLVLRDVSVIDGSGMGPRAHTTIVIASGRIADVFPDGTRPTPADAQVLDLPGRWVIPGLIDAHVHVATDPRGRDANAADQLRGALAGGVTMVRDMAGDAVVLHDLAKVAEAADAPSPRISYAAVFGGPSFFDDPRTRAAAHGDVPGQVPWLRAITPETDVAAAVTAAKATGASAVKIYADLPPALVSRVAREAHAQGMKVWSHATVYPSRPGDAVEAGVDAVSHAVLLYWQGATDVPQRYHTRAVRSVYDSVNVHGAAIDSLLTAMRLRGTVLDATLFISSRLETAPAGTAGMVDPKRAVQWMYDVTRRAIALGVTVDAGTDGMMPGNPSELPNIHREMELLVTRAGFTPLQAITAATLNSAKAIGVESETGTITVGKRADLVILGGDPVTDIRNTRNIQFVVKGGRIHGRSEP